MCLNRMHDWEIVGKQISVGHSGLSISLINVLFQWGNTYTVISNLRRVLSGGVIGMGESFMKVKSDHPNGLPISSPKEITILF